MPEKTFNQVNLLHLTLEETIKLKEINNRKFDHYFIINQKEVFSIHQT
jgi:hypothetical protein